MSDDDDEGFLSAETLRILNFYEAQYKKCAGNAAATDAALGPAQGDGGGGSEVEPQPADAGGYLKSVGRKESTARLEEQQLPTGSGELIPRSSLPLGPGVLKRFSASPPPPANDKAQRPELSVEEAYRQTIQQKDGEISVLRQRLSKVEEERIAAIQKAASHPESTKLKGLRAELDSAKHEVKQLQIKLDLAEQEVQEAQRSARLKLQEEKQAAEVVGFARTDGLRRPSLPPRGAEAEFPEIGSSGSVVVASNYGPRKPKIRKTSTVQPARCERPVENLSPEGTQAELSLASRGRKTQQTQVVEREEHVAAEAPQPAEGVAETRDLMLTAVDVSRLETMAVMRSRENEILELYGTAGNRALQRALLQGDSCLASSLEPLLDLLKKPACSTAACAVLESASMFSEGCRQYLSENEEKLAALESSEAFTTSVSLDRAYAYAGLGRTQVLEDQANKSDFVMRAVQTLAAVAQTERSSLPEDVIQNVVRLCGRLLSGEVPRDIRRRAIFALLRLVSSSEGNMRSVLKSPLKITARSALLLDQLLDEVDACKTETADVATHQRSWKLAELHATAFLAQEVLMMVCLLVRGAHSGGQVKSCLGLTRNSLYRALHLIVKNSQAFPAASRADAQLLLALLADVYS